MGINVLSLFDGMSCGQIALDQLEIEVDNYFASEIDKFAIKVTQSNYPSTIQIGDVTQVKGSDLPNIDLLIGGSPCQGFSFAGSQLNFEDERSKLFFEFVRILEEVKPRYFMLENVRMKQEYQDVITDLLGVKPIEINSNLVSAQNRRRLYWTNIPDLTKPEDKGIILRDILESDVDDKYYLSDKAIAYMSRERRGKPRWEYHKNDLDSKSSTLVAVQYKGVPYGVIKDEQNRHNGFRRLTPLECERLQTVPDNYTQSVSDTQRYKMLGNGWTVEVIKHIFKNIEL